MGTSKSLPVIYLNNVLNLNSEHPIAQYILPAPDAFIAMGWSNISGDHDCPEGLRCDTLDWEIKGKAQVLQPSGVSGAWDAVKTKEGRGWRVVWKKDLATVHQEVQILVKVHEQVLRAMVSMVG